MSSQIYFYTNSLHFQLKINADPMIIDSLFYLEIALRTIELQTNTFCRHLKIGVINSVILKKGTCIYLVFKYHLFFLGWRERNISDDFSTCQNPKGQENYYHWRKEQC